MRAFTSSILAVVLVAQESHAFIRSAPAALVSWGVGAAGANANKENCPAEKPGK